MKEITCKVYQYDELSDKAKEKARDWYKETMDYPWFEEDRESLEAFIEHFGLTKPDYSVGAFCPSYARADVKDENREGLQGARLWKYLQNSGLLRYYNEYHKKTENLLDGDCPFTGYASDEDLLDAIREFMKRPNKNTTYADLMRESLDAWALAVQRVLQTRQALE